MNVSRPRLRISPLPAAGGRPVCYGTGSLMQISPTECLQIANRRILGVPVVDLEDGADAFAIGALDDLDGARAPMPLLRNEEDVHPQTGRRLLMVQYLMTGGFVPLGALLPDGTPHPATGTGFGIGCALGFGADLSENIRPGGADLYARMNILQFRYDGREFAVDRIDRIENNEVIPGFRVLRHPINNAIPDGEDLVSGLVAGPIEAGADPYIPIDHRSADAELGRNYGCCCARWRYGRRGWQVSAVHPATPGDMSFEPSIVRDLDGALLMSVRGKGLQEPPCGVHDGLENTYEHLRVLRSTDNGESWRPAVHLPRRRNATPVVLNRTLAGAPFLAANPWRAARVREGSKPLSSTMRRWRLCLWPLTADRQAVSEGICVLDCEEKWGLAREGAEDRIGTENAWCLDHPIGSICRLRDGRLHCLLDFRISDRAVNQGGMRTPADPAGHWIEEVTDPDEGEARPVWAFAEGHKAC